MAWLGQVFWCLSFVSYIQLWVHVLSSYILIILQIAWPVFAHIERVYTLCKLLVWIWLWPSPWSTSVRVCVGLQSALTQRGIYGKQQQQALSQNIWAGQRVTQAWQFFVESARFCKKSWREYALFDEKLRCILCLSGIPCSWTLCSETWMGIALEDEPSLSTCLPRRESLSDQKTWQRTRPIHPVSSLHALIRSVLSHLCPCASFQRWGMTFWLFTASPLSVVTLRHLHPLQPFLWTLQSALSGRGFSSRLTWIKNFHRHFCQTRSWSFSALTAFSTPTFFLYIKILTSGPKKTSSAASKDGAGLGW